MWLVVILASDDHLLCIFFNKKKKWTDNVLFIPFKEREKKKPRPNLCLPNFFFFLQVKLGHLGSICKGL
jgi:hypothetical protein